MRFLLLTGLLLFFTTLAFRAPEEIANEKIQGLSFVAPPSPFEKDPMPAIKEVGADWIAVIPFGYSRANQPVVRYNTDGGFMQWWGERPEGVRETIALARQHDLKVMLKPQIYVPGSWPGGIDFDTPQDWEEWERQYEDFILFFAQLAEEEKVELLCIGTEFKIAIQKRTPFWLKLIDKIRNKYSGALTYAANWDEYEKVPVTIWRKLNYAGIDAYFPLVEKTTPSVTDLKQAWQPTLEEVRQFYRKARRPVIFTEYGYLTVDGCAGKAWELEKRIHRLPVNQQAQANAIQAKFETFWEEPWFAGSFLWKWFPNGKGHEGYPERDYTPQGKLSQQVLENWWKE